MNSKIANASPAFKHCPECGARMGHSRVGNVISKCPNGDFVQYNNPKPCVAVLIISDGRVLLGERAVEPKKGYWDILGGFIDSGEGAEEAAKREIREETGLSVEQLTYLTSIPDVYGETGIPTLNFCFLAEASGKEMASSDVKSLKWFSIDELPSRMAFEHQSALIDFYKRWRKAT